MNFEKLIFRKAASGDLPSIVAMLNNDILGKNRENPDDFYKYRQAFDEISEDKNNFLIVIEFENEVIGTMQLTLIPTIVLQGSKRMNIEAVRVDDKLGGKGIGSWMIKKAIIFAEANGVKIIQLTTNKQRNRAHEFYKRLGFEATHEGMKLKL
jgi:N-acetylglutamate synthase-like GNAT family acetyltransferase